MNLKQHRSKASLMSLGSSSNDILNSIVYYFRKQTFDLNSKIIDIGCGQGELLSQIKTLGFNNLIGCDYTHFDANSGFEFFQHDCNQEFPSHISEMDIILCSEVIEHLENPWAFIRSLNSIGKRGSHIILSTPNPESYLSILTLFTKGYFNAFGPSDYPAHITPICTYELGNMLNQAQVTNHHFNYIANGRIPGSSVKWRKLFPFLKGKRFSDNYFVHAIL